MANDKTNNNPSDKEKSFWMVRRAVGGLGFFLPTVLIVYSIVFAKKIENSISEYYYTQMGDIVVGTMCAIGLFLLVYKGYERNTGEIFSDKWVARFAGLGALGVGLFPAQKPVVKCFDNCPVFITTGFTNYPAWAHVTSAGLFYACLAIFCLVLFPRGDCDDTGKAMMTPRNKAYRACGMFIVVAMVMLALQAVPSDWLQGFITSFPYVFIWETVGVFAFATAWLIKGRGLFPSLNPATL